MFVTERLPRLSPFLGEKPVDNTDAQSLQGSPGGFRQNLPII